MSFLSLRFSQLIEYLFSNPYFFKFPLNFDHQKPFYYWLSFLGITNDNRFLFIDHLPGFNGPFNSYHSNIAEAYSPRKHLQALFRDKKGKSRLFNLKSRYDSQFDNDEEREKFDEELNRRVNDRLFKGIPEKGFYSLERVQ